MSIPRTALVTGATGFLGGRLARRLHDEGCQVTCLGRNRTAGGRLEACGMRFVCADLADADAVSAACRGQEVVFHCGANSSPWGRYRDFYRANVLGTRHVVAGCRQHGVRRLVHVSTPSLYFDFRDRFGISEAEPPASPSANQYVRTKLLAEAEVDAAAAAIEVITLRPRAIFGPGDTALFPRLIRANSPRGFPLIGPGDPLIDVTYVENAVDALLAACAAPAGALNRKYNITNGEPWLRSSLLSTLFAEIGLPFRARPVGYSTAYRLAALMEAASKLFTLGKWEPPLTRYTVGVLSRSQTLDITAARHCLGYTPRVTVAEGMREFGIWWEREKHDGA